MRLHIALLLALPLALLGCSGGDGPDSPPPASPPGAPPTTPPPAPPAAGPPVTALFVLGDSLSDVGNAAGVADYALNRPIQPPTVGLCNPADVVVIPRPCDDLFYRQARVSDGPVAVEYLAAALGLPELTPSFHIVPSKPSAGPDYAVASAKARGPSAEDLTTQVDMLLLDRAPLPVDALYVVMIGGNDAIDALQALGSGDAGASQASAAIVSLAVDAIGANVERLLDFGARRLIVANVPDLAALPAVLEEARASSNETDALAAARSISDAFARELDARLDRTAADARWGSPQLLRFDLRAALQDEQTSAVAAGRNARDACFDSDAYRESATGERVFHPDCAPGSGAEPRFAGFVFWDGIHPTAVAHAAIGAALVDLVD